MKDIVVPLPKLPERLDRHVHIVRLLIGGRAVRIILIDTFLLFGQLLLALLEGGRAADIYNLVVLVPLVILGSILLSETIALERDAGTIELALTARSAFYFEWRLAVIVGLLMLQGCLTMILARAFFDRFPLPFVLIQTVLVTLFFGSVALFWMTRLRQGGSVLFATIITFLALGKWTLANPVAVFGDNYTGLERAAVIAWISPNLFFLTGSLILYAYARRALRSPETLMAR